jgi:hypothetical protein
VPTWEYDAGEPWRDKKHGWHRAEAGVKRVRGLGRVGTCPNDVTRALARELLNAGLFFFEEDEPLRPPDAFPDNVFMIYKGVPYESRATVRGRSFHSFPVLPERFVKLPESVRDWLRARAAEQGYNVEDWLKAWPA